ncbi:hypothetical protein Goklo_005181, partial [Gossypium klotzschianum]|nr:hypothetical protein [Gossypium klotzschianum]
MEVLPHFSHAHPLVFNDERNHESGEVFCCAREEVVSGPRFSCMEFEFHLDKNCAKALVEMDHPFHHKHNLKLMASSPYVEDNECKTQDCTICHKEVNMACGSYYCSECKFIIHVNCALQEVDGHCLVFTFHEDTDYSEYLYCDICEKQRSPYTWFYHCAICDNSAHLHCVVGDHPFIKRGMTFIESHHPHVLVFVEKMQNANTLSTRAAALSITVF